MFSNLTCLATNHEPLLEGATQVAIVSAPTSRISKPAEGLASVTFGVPRRHREALLTGALGRVSLGQRYLRREH
jgi:hypothetical protein